MVERHALVLYPETETYTTQALVKAFKKILPDWHVDTSRHSEILYDLQYADYDAIDWDAAENAKTLVNSYMLRKALIRKNYLATAVAHRLAKHPDSILKQGIPKTYAFEIAHADELDELFYDELYDVAQSLEDEGSDRWWILKPAMADRGQGIRLFNSKEALQAILDSFDDEDSDDEDEEDKEGQSSTKVSLNSMRDWVIQEYVSKPLLFDTKQLQGRESRDKGRKFHLRVYVLAVGSLEVYIYTDMLALFAASVFEPPAANLDDDDEAVQDLTAHLTNTCLQDATTAQNNVFLFSELTGRSYLSHDTHESLGVLSQEQSDSVILRIGEVVAETFRAGLGMSNHFSTAPNAFEVFGIDILLSTPEESSSDIPVQLLEVNACPDFRQTGDDRHHVIEELFEGVLDIAVKPYFDDPSSTAPEETPWKAGERRGKWLKSLDANDA
ncbi:tubulin-tyrosine ligase [Cystobasidium minutum MCA 4210]|uniref:tubulin-tyrosine ligase n=1 Tax=Cystobasidium minutum MCA 4210 TaxID=1397322 RepID=UPI0034D002C8|eukprot:jgi/Rhomi1/76955/CE76954_238